MILKKSLVKYSLVIPCYNESDNLPILVERCQALLNIRADIEVLLVDNGSTDGTHEVLGSLLKGLRQINLRTIRIYKNKGYGFGIVSGLRECNGEVIGWTHADLQSDPLDFISAISFFENSAHPSQIFVKGSRVNRPLKDAFFTLGMSIVEWILLGARMWDINAQPTVFSKVFFTSLKGMPNDFSLDLFTYYQAIDSGVKVKRFPVNFGLRLKGVGHNETLMSKLQYSYKTMLYSANLRKRLKERSK